MSKKNEELNQIVEQEYENSDVEINNAFDNIPEDIELDDIDGHEDIEDEIPEQEDVSMEDDDPNGFINEVELSDEDVNKALKGDLAQLKKIREKERARQRVGKERTLSVSGILQASTQSRSDKEVVGKLRASQQRRSILTAKIISFQDMLLGDVPIPCAIIRFGNYKGIIPYNDFADLSVLINQARSNQKYTNLTDVQITSKLMQRYLGAEIDFVVKERIGKADTIDSENMFFFGDRMAALRKKSLLYWVNYSSQPSGAVIKEGKHVEARIIAVQPKSIIVEIFGVITVIRAEELSWKRIDDVRPMFNVGQFIEVMIDEIKREGTNIQATVSHKKTFANPQAGIARFFSEQAYAYGQVTGLTENCVYVVVAETYEFRCKPQAEVMNLSGHGPQRKAVVGDMVKIRVNKIDSDRFRAFGDIKQIL